MMKKIEEIIQISKGKKPKLISKVLEKGLMPYVDIKAFEQKIIDNYTDGEKCLPCEDGDLLIVCDGSRSGLVGRAVKGYVGSTLARIDIDKSVLPEYIYHFIQGKYIQLNTSIKGTGTPHLNQELLKSFELYVPPLEDQHRIVTRIEEFFSQLDSGVETLKKTKEQLKVYRQAVLKEIFEKYNNFCKISEVCSNIVDCPHSTPKWTSSGKLCLRTTNFRRGYLDLSEPNYVSDETFEERIKRLKPCKGDVLYSREGAILGIACIIPDNTELCLGQRMMLLRANEEYSPFFIMHWLNSPYVTNYIRTITGGSASPHVNVGDIKSQRIPKINLEEQNNAVKEIESRLSVCDSIEKTIDTALQEAEALRQSILKQAFEGGL